MDNKTRQEKIASYGSAYQRLTTALKKYPRNMWQFRSSPGQWTIHEIIVHIADSEVSSFFRCRRFVAEPGSMVLGYDQDKWANALDYHKQNADDALELFRYLRKMSYDLIKKLPENIWANTVIHSENGEMTMDTWLNIYDRHITDHIVQMDGIFNTWEKSQ